MGLVDTVRLAEERERYRRFVFGVAYVRLPGTAHYTNVRQNLYCHCSSLLTALVPRQLENDILYD